jgi:hypothetical protein
MINYRRQRFSLFLIVTLLSFFFLLDASGADSENPVPKDMPEGMGPPPGAPPGVPPGAPPGAHLGVPPGAPPGGFSANAPSKAAIYIENGTENSSNEYTARKYSENIQSGANGITIQNLELFSGDYTFNGIVAVGAKTNVTLDKCKIRLGVDKAARARDKGGSAIAVDEGATMQIKNSNLQVDGAGRYVTSNYNDGTLIVNDSIITSTGSNTNTSEIAEPFSNAPLLISGTARTNFSVGASKTYYFNSTCKAEGWAAFSTDAPSPEGLDLYVYNSKGIALNGGYATYADFGSRVWLYGSMLKSPEIGAIISKSGLITLADGSAAPEAVTRYNLGKTTASGTTIIAGRNAVMIHAPDMFGKGKAAADNGTLNVINSTLATTRNLKSTRNYTATYGKAIGAYVDYTSGPAILVKSTSANINLENTKIDSFSGIIAMTVLNSDKMGNFLADGDAESEEVKPIAISMKDMDAQGDIQHMDYQRIMTLSLDNVTLKGMVISGTMEEWNNLWTAYNKADCNWLKDESWNSYYGVRMTVKKGSTWNVTGRSTLSSLTIEKGGIVNANIQVDGNAITPSAGKTYTGKIVVMPL